MNRQNKRKLWIVLGASLVSVSLVKLPTSLSIPTKMAVSTSRISPTGSSAAVQVFASQVETLGANKYPNTFAGAKLTSKGVIKVYALSPTDPQLIKAINAINTNKYSLDIIGTGRSYAQLNVLNTQLGTAYKQLKKNGINLLQSWPDPSSGSVRVSIRKPNLSDISTLSSSINKPVTKYNYLKAASALFTSKFGLGITVQPQYGQTAVSVGRTK